jgi:hypothetical protein
MILAIGQRLGAHSVMRLLANLDIKLATRDEQQEVAGYADALETVREHVVSIDLSENPIKQLHRDLLQYSAKDLL